MFKRRYSPSLFLLAAVCSFGLAIATTVHASYSPLMNSYYSLALQGDLSTAAELFSTAESPSEEEAKLAKGFRTRFIERIDDAPPASADPLVDDLIRSYRDYWTRSLMGELAAEEGRSYLLDQIAGLLRRYNVAISNDDILETIKSAVEERGYHLLGGTTRPWLELMIWKTEDVRSYTVELTDRKQPVKVALIGDFVSFGWAHYATFGKTHTGGWAATDRLYCLRDGYDLESEAFLISYLRHEGRHFADYELFPSLDQIELEYRAKLTELAFAESSLLDRLKMFTAHAMSNPNTPHPYANHAVIRDLSAAVFGSNLEAETDWNSVAPADIHAAARELLATNTAALTRAGSDTTVGIIAEEAATRDGE